MNLIYDETTAVGMLGEVVDSMWIPKTALVKWLSKTTSTIFFQLKTGVLVVLGDEGRVIFPNSALLDSLDTYFEYDVTQLAEFVLNTPGSEVTFQIRVNHKSINSGYVLTIALGENVITSTVLPRYQTT